MDNGIDVCFLNDLGICFFWFMDHSRRKFGNWQTKLKGNSKEMICATWPKFSATVFQCLSLQSHSHFSGGFYDGLHWYSPCTLIETPGGNLNLLALLMVISHLCWILGCKLGYLAIVNGKYSHSTIKKIKLQYHVHSSQFVSMVKHKKIFLLGIRCNNIAPHSDLPFFPMLRIPHWCVRVTTFSQLLWGKMMSEDAHFARAMLQRRAQLLRSFLDRHGFDYVNRPRSLKGSLIFWWFMNMFDILCTYV